MPWVGAAGSPACRAANAISGSSSSSSNTSSKQSMPEAMEMLLEELPQKSNAESTDISSCAIATSNASSAKSNPESTDISSESCAIPRKTFVNHNHLGHHACKGGVRHGGMPWPWVEGETTAAVATMWKPFVGPRRPFIGPYSMGLPSSSDVWAGRHCEDVTWEGGLSHGHQGQYV